jgi:phytanoyl-CoA hydroxylase
MSLLDASQISRFHRDGYLLGPNVVDRASLETLRAELDRVIEQRDRADVPQPTRVSNLGGDESHPVWQIVNIWLASDAFRHLLNIEGLGEAMQALIGGDHIRLWHDQVQYKPKDIGGTTAWHQDWPYWPTMSQPNAVTAWIALDDADADNGCMSMVPGSHRWGNAITHLHTIKGISEMPASWDGRDTPARLCPVPAGAVHFHHSLTWHGSHNNTSARPRRAIALHFMNEQVRKNPGDQHLCSRYCESADGEPISGARFPLIWSDGAPRTAAAVKPEPALA